MVQQNIRILGKKLHNLKDWEKKKKGGRDAIVPNVIVLFPCRVITHF